MNVDDAMLELEEYREWRDEDVIDWDEVAPDRCGLGLFLWVGVVAGGAVFGALVAWLGARWLDA